MAIIENPASGGLVIRRAEHYVDRGSFLELINAQLESVGTISRRTGYDELSDAKVDGGTIDPELATAVFYRDEELCLLAEDRLWSYVPELAQWADRGEWIQGRARVKPLLNDTENQDHVDSAVVGGFRLSLWSTSEGRVVAVVDGATSGIEIARLEVAASDGSSPRIATMDTWAAFVWYEAGAPSALKMRRWSLASPAVFAAEQTIVSGADLVEPYDAVALIGADTMLVSYYEDSSPGPLTFNELDDTGASVQSNSVSIDVDPLVGVTPGFRGIGIVPLTGHIDSRIAVVGATYTPQGGIGQLAMYWLDAALAIQSLVVNAGAGVGSGPLGYLLAGIQLNTTTVLWYVDKNSNSEDTPAVDQWEAERTTTTTTTIGIDDRQGLQILARPFARGTDYLIPVALSDNDGSVSFGQASVGGVFAVSRSWTVHLRALENAQARETLEGKVVPSTTVDGDLVSWPVAQQDEILFVSEEGSLEKATVEFDLAIIEMDMAPRPVAVAYLDGVAHVAGAGIMRIYDGVSVGTLDFHASPIGDASGLAGPGPAVGTYSYSLQWEWSDDSGQLYRSAPYIFSFTVVLVTETVTLFVGQLRLRQRDNVRLLVGRTEQGETADFYRLDDPTNPTFTDDPDGSSIQFVDTFADADIINNERLEQVGQPAQRVNDPTPATDFVALAADRLWFGDPAIGNAVRYSKPKRDGFGVEMTSIQAVKLDTAQRATGLASQDASFFGFTADKVSNWSGGGPDVFGVGGFTRPTRQPIEIGAIGQTVILETPYGIVYSSVRGPRSLARDRQGQAPFAGITEAYDFLGQTTTTATYDPRTSEVRWYDDGPDVNLADIHLLLSQKRMTIRFNLLGGRGTHDSSHQARDAATSVNAASAFLRTDGVVCVHSASTRTDGSRALQLSALTTWLRPGRDTGHTYKAHAITIAGQYLGEHKLLVALAQSYRHYLPPAGVSGFAPVVLMETNRDGSTTSPKMSPPKPLRDVPTTWEDGSGDSYQWKWNITGTYQALAVLLQDVDFAPDDDALVICAVDIVYDETSVLPNAQLDPRRSF